VLAVKRSIASVGENDISWWKLMNRDGLNLYAVCMKPSFEIDQST
jgi:hypothetical protein